MISVTPCILGDLFGALGGGLLLWRAVPGEDFRNHPF